MEVLCGDLAVTKFFAAARLALYDRRYKRNTVIIETLWVFLFFILGVFQFSIFPTSWRYSFVCCGFCVCCVFIIRRFKLALGVLTSVEQLVPVFRPPAFLGVPLGLGSSPVGSCSAPPWVPRGSSGLGVVQPSW